MNYNIGDIIKTAGYYGVIIDCEIVTSNYLYKAFWRYTIKKICENNGYEVYKSQRYIKRTLVGVDVVNELPVLKKAWWWYKKNHIF